jgi:2-oxoglutarate dehydrogenase E1 component
LDIARKATAPPEGFNIYRKLQRLMNTRLAMVENGEPMDWGCAEMLSLGSLLLEGTSVRLTGQDSQRGTFSHRHGVWHDVKTGDQYWPLSHLAEKQGELTLLNSMLSELAVVGFEYGLSSADPTRLTIWEAQFGDFANMAQPIIDQFLSSAEAKWQRMSGFVMLLPHGYEGQGPEHSSARLERYLQLCSEKNMQVCCPTTPAQYFHMLRRQMHRPFRKPLIVMMPKSLLRHKESTSHIDELTSGEFQNILDDPDSPDPKKVRRVLFCSGKVFFDLLDGRRTKKADSVAIVRMEQLHPFPKPECERVLKHYSKAEEWVWVQEEPQNQGSWDYVEPKLKGLVDGPVSYIGRRPGAATATGVHRVHTREQESIVEQATDI